MKERDTLGHIVIWTIYTSHIDYFTPQNTAFEQFTACSSVFWELLVNNIVIRWVNFGNNRLHEHELPLPDYNT